MIRLCGIKGDPQGIRAFLQHNCDCHPLVVGVLAGLVNDYPYDRGNFDGWVRDQSGGAALKLGELDLVNRQNHILLAAISALDADSRWLLHLLSVLQGAVDFRTIEALARTRLHAVPSSDQNSNLTAPMQDLASIIRNLERRGLLQYDSSEQRYDLHPVVRGVAAARIEKHQENLLGQTVVDHFTRKQHDPWVHAETLEELADGIQIVSAYLRMGRYPEAFYALQGELANALYFNLHAFAELLSLAEGFFVDGWSNDPRPAGFDEIWYILNLAAAAISPISHQRSQELTERAIHLAVQKKMTNGLFVSITTFVGTLDTEARMSDVARLRSLAQDLATVSRDPELVFMSKFREYVLRVIRGDWSSADSLWEELESLGRDWSPGNYRPGDAEGERARDLLYRGALTDEAISRAEEISKREGNRRMVRTLHEIRGEWHLERKEPRHALDCFSRALAMYRQNGFRSSYCEARILLARVKLGEAFDARGQSEEIEVASVRCAFAMAELWRSLGEGQKAIEAAATVYCSASKWRDVLPRYYLDRSAMMLKELGAELPVQPDSGYADERVLPWEADVAQFIEGLRFERGDDV